MQTSWVIGFRGSSYLAGQRRFNRGSSQARLARASRTVADHVGPCPVLT